MTFSFLSKIYIPPLSTQSKKKSPMTPLLFNRFGVANPFSSSISAMKSGESRKLSSSSPFPDRTLSSESKDPSTIILLRFDFTERIGGFSGFLIAWESKLLVEEEFLTSDLRNSLANAKGKKENLR